MKKIISIIILSLMIFPLAGCNNDSSTYQLPPEREEGTKVELTLLSTYNDEEYEVLKQIISLFENEHKDIKVNVDRAVSGAHFNRITKGLAMGEAPDIAMVDMELVGLLANRSAIVNLNVLGAEEITGEYIESAIQSTTLKNKVWGIPDQISPVVLFYNKDILDDANVKYPKEQWTWDVFKDALVEVSDLEGVYGLSIGDSFLETLPILNSFGAKLNGNVSKSIGDSSEVLEALEFITDLVEKGFAPNPWSDGTEERVAGFKKGKYAFVLGDIKLIEELEESDVDYGITLIPKGQSDSYSDLTGTSMVIFQQSHHPREAYKFIRFLTSEKMQIKWANELGKIPVINSATDQIDYEKHPHLTTFMDQLQRVQPKPLFIDPQGFEEVLNSELKQVFDGTKGIQQALEDAANSLK